MTSNICLGAYAWMFAALVCVFAQLKVNALNLPVVPPNLPFPEQTEIHNPDTMSHLQENSHGNPQSNAVQAKNDDREEKDLRPYTGADQIPISTDYDSKQALPKSAGLVEGDRGVNVAYNDENYAEDKDMQLLEYDIVKDKLETDLTHHEFNSNDHFPSFEGDPSQFSHKTRDDEAYSDTHSIFEQDADHDYNDTLTDYYDYDYEEVPHHKEEAESCQVCKYKEMERDRKKLAFKTSLMSRLKLKNPPNMTGVARPRIPGMLHLWDEHGMLKDSPQMHRFSADDEEVKTQRVFTMAKEYPPDLGLNLTDGVFFSLSQALYTAEIKKAHLWVYIMVEESDIIEGTNANGGGRGRGRRRHRKPPACTLTISRIMPESRTAKRAVTKTTTSQEIRSKVSTWRRIDIADVLMDWIAKPVHNLGLRISCLDKSGRNRAVLVPASEKNKGYEPWMDIRVSEGRSRHRGKRNTNNICSTSEPSSFCCRYVLDISFMEMGWDWVIAPTSVRADYCSGECHNSGLAETPRGWLAQNVDAVEAASCCVPTKMLPLSILYFDTSDSVIYQLLQNVKVDRCGCI